MKKLLYTLTALVMLVVLLSPAALSLAPPPVRAFTVDGVTYTALSTDVSGEGWSWIAGQQQLWLNGYNGSSITVDSAGSALNLHLSGTNTITSSHGTAFSAVSNEVRITAESGGCLNIIAAGNNAVGMSGIFSIESGTVSVSANGTLSAVGIFTQNGSLKISGTASLIVVAMSGLNTAELTGFSAQAGGLSVSTSGTVSIACVGMERAAGNAVKADFAEFSGMGVSSFTASGTGKAFADLSEPMKLSNNTTVSSPSGAEYSSLHKTYVSNGTPCAELVVSYSKPVYYLERVLLPEHIYGLDNGTPKSVAGLRLPTNVTVITSGGERECGVTWDIDGCTYDPSLGSAQEFTVNGLLVLPDDILADSVEVSVKLSVKSVTFVAVEGIEGFPESIHIGETTALDTYVLPTYASSNHIQWAVLDDGGTGLVIINGVITAMKPGTATVRATIIGGKGLQEVYYEDFTLNVRKTRNDILPDAPRLAAVGADFIELHPVFGAEYALITEGSEIVWQSSPRFSGLWGSVEYSFAVRIAETDITECSQQSATVNFTTAQRVVTYIPNDSETFIDGNIEGGRFTPDMTLQFTAVGGGMQVPSPIIGDERLLPVSWSVKEQHDFGNDYTAQLRISDYDYGDAVLTVVFERQRFDGYEWQKTGELVRTASFTVLGEEIGGLSIWQLVMYLCITFVAAAVLLLLFIYLVRRADGKKLFGKKSSAAEDTEQAIIEIVEEPKKKKRSKKSTDEIIPEPVPEPIHEPEQLDEPSEPSWKRDTVEIMEPAENFRPVSAKPENKEKE